MTPFRRWLENYRILDTSVQVLLGDDRCLPALGVGQLDVYLRSGVRVTIHDIYYAPGLTKSLISVFATTSQGSFFEFFHTHCVVHFKLPSGQFELIKLQQREHLYELKQSPRQWNFCFHNCMQNLGYTRFLSEPNVYQ
ncbi:hypothetical protein KP509_1Z127600 [Ceratopteris richardii]|nr:hypothetical protein KP509_1Z127600 [Ceratopteris richardii]